jgi:hypothetical protein
MGVKECNDIGHADAGVALAVISVTVSSSASRSRRSNGSEITFCNPARKSYLRSDICRQVVSREDTLVTRSDKQLPPKFVILIPGSELSLSSSQKAG